MEYRRLGGDGPVSSALGLGCFGFAGCYGDSSREQAIATIRLALTLGITLFDMADFYGGGSVEELAGQAIAGHRHEALIATAGGIRFTSSSQPAGADGTPGYLRQACDASLRRLRTDHIDLYYLSGVDRDVPVEESVGTLAELVAAGKIRHIGLAGTSAEELRRAHAEHPITAVQGEYSLWERRAAEDILPALRASAAGFIACSPLGRGFLTGRVTSQAQLAPGDCRKDDARFKPGSLARNRETLRAAEDMAARKNVSIGRLAIAWLLAQGDDIVPIPGARQRTHLEMNVAALGVPLTAAESRELTALFPVSAWGARRPAQSFEAN